MGALISPVDGCKLAFMFFEIQVCQLVHLHSCVRTKNEGQIQAPYVHTSFSPVVLSNLRILFQASAIFRIW